MGARIRFHRQDGLEAGTGQVAVVVGRDGVEDVYVDPVALAADPWGVLGLVSEHVAAARGV